MKTNGLLKIVFLILTVLLMCLAAGVRGQAPTRSQLQPVNARYQWESGGFKNVLYIPLDTPHNAEPGAIAYKNGAYYQKDTLRWNALGSAGTVVADNMANKDLDLTGDRIHNGKGHYFKLDTLAYLQYMVYRNDPFLGNKYYSKMYLDSTINGFPFRFISALRNTDNTSDSIHTQFGTNQNGAFIYNYGLNGNRYGYFQFLGNDDSARMDIALQSGFKYSSFSFGHTTYLTPSDSFRIKLMTGTSAPKMIGLINPVGSVYTPVAIDMGNFLTGLHGAVNATGPGDALTTLSNTGVVPGVYTNLNATIGSDGRIITATNGSAPIGDLQAVTARGNKTKDTIISAGIRTPLLLSDTLNQPDFEFSVFPDVQGMTSGFPAMLTSMFDWVISHKDSNNIKALLTLGDLTDHANTTEYGTIRTQFDRIDSLATLPYLPIVGNHDYDGGEISVPRPTTMFNSYFGVSSFSGKSWEGNSFHGKTENHYIKVDVEGIKFLMLGVEFIPTDSALNWASAVIDSFPDRKVIITTHSYITCWGERSTDTSFYGTNTYGLNAADNSGQEMWDKMIRKKKNVIMVLNGHFVNTASENMGYSRRITDMTDSGNIVHQIFVNYQRDGNGSFSNPTGSNNVGMGYFMRLRFSPKKGKVYASYYSSYLNQYDVRIDSFNVDLPGVVIQSSPTATGQLVVLKAARFNDTVAIKSIPKYSVVISGDDNKLVGYPGISYKSGALLVNKIGVGISSPLRPLHVVGAAIADTVLGGTTSTDSLRLMSTSDALKGKILFGNSAYNESTNQLGIGTTSPAGYIDIRTNSDAANGLEINNNSAGTSAGSRVLFRNETRTATGQVLFCNSTSVFSPNGLIINAGGTAGKLSLASIIDDITFGKSTTINGANEHARFKNNGNFLIGGITDNGYKTQIYGAGYIKDSLAVDNMLTGNNSDSLVVTRNGVLRRIQNTTATVLKGTTTWAPGIVSAGSSTITTLSVTGAALGDPVTVSKASGAYSNGEIYDAFVSATNTVTIRVHNVSTGSANYSTTETYNIVLLKY